MFNEICINEEMLPKYTYINIYTHRQAHKITCVYIYIYIYIYILLTKMYWLNIANITPHSPDDGSVEPKHYSVDFLINLSFRLDYLVTNFSTYCQITILYLLSYIYIYIYIIVMLIAWTYLTLSCHPSLLAGPLYSIQCLYRTDECKFFAVLPTLVCPYVIVQWRMLLISLSLLIRQWSACFVYLTWMVYETGGKWLDNWNFSELHQAFSSKWHW